MQKFWMVFVPKRETPSFIHQTKASAKAEAWRLAGLGSNAGLPVYLLEAIASCQVKPKPAEVEWEELAD